MADRITNKTVTVGTSAVVIALELLEGQRKDIFITNTSTAGQVITVSIGDDAVSGKGIVLSPGGIFSSSQDGSGYYPPSSFFSAISDGASGTLAIIERVGKEVIR